MSRNDWQESDCPSAVRGRPASVSPSQTVLIVDDDPATLPQISRITAVNGSCCVAVRTAAQARKFAEIRQPEIVLLALDLPDASGYELCREWQGVIASGAREIILLAEEDSFSQRLTGFRCGASDYLVKPLNLIEVIRALDGAMQRKTPQEKKNFSPQANSRFTDSDQSPEVYQIASLPTPAPELQVTESDALEMPQAAASNASETQNVTAIENPVSDHTVAPAPEPENRRVLVADDNAQVMRVLALMLEREGFEVLQATDGGKALELYYENRPRLVVLDYFMPVRDGFQVLREIRRTASSNEVPVIMVTSKGLESDIEEAFHIGASDYVTKPFSPRELTARIKARYASSVNARSR